MTDYAFDPAPAKQSLEAKLDKLVDMCHHLSQENQSLKARESDWMRERTRLMEKNELARTRVEAMITRLKSMESTQ